MNTLLWPDWDPGGSMSDSVGIRTFPERYDVLYRSPVMVPPMIGVQVFGGNLRARHAGANFH